MKFSDIFKNRKAVIWAIAGATVFLIALGATIFFTSRRQVVINQQSQTAASAPEAVAPLAPIGDSFSDRTASAVLYYLDANEEKLIATVRSVNQTGSVTLPEAIMTALLTPPTEPELSAVAPSDVQLLSLEKSSGIITVNLSIEARRLEAEQLFRLRAAIVNTMTELPGIRGVNVLIDGREEGLIQLPAGTMTRMSSDVYALWMRAMDEDAKYDGTVTQNTALTRDVTLYYGANTADYLLPEVRSIRIEQNDYLGSIVNALLKGSSKDKTRLLPEGAEYMRYDPALVLAEDGTKVASISFTGAISDYFELHGISTERAFGSLTLSICTFVPEVDGVIVDIDGSLVTGVYDSAGELALTFDDNVMRRSDFEYLIGDTCKIYFPTDDGGALLPIYVAVSRHEINSPRALITQLMRQPVNPYPGRTLVQPMPSAARDADLLGVREDGDQVLLNFSGEFYRACRQLNRAQERALVYSIVNTVCELSGVKYVRFYFDGERVDTLSGGIYLRGPLMSNVGMVSAG